jgi:hypothetical protein
MIGLVINVVILCLILGLVLYIFRVVPILTPFAWLANVICVIIIVLFLIHLLSGFGGGSWDFPVYHAR